LKRWRSVSKNLPIETRLTKAPGHASVLAREAVEQGFEAVIGVGGDGTLGEVVDGYLSLPAAARGHCSLSTWPAGSGCDTARHFKIGGGPKELAALLKKPRKARLDAGSVVFMDTNGRPQTRYFINVVTLGLGGDVARRVAKSGKPLGGTLTYLASSIAAIARAKPYPLSLVVDGVAQAVAGYHLLAVANTSTTGGGMKIAPSADAGDGRLDLISVGALARAALLRKLPLVYMGKHLGQAGVHHEFLRRLEVRSEQTVYVNVDGEAAGTLPASFEILPGAVPFLLLP
jgi:diacylglycerol kinase (ATP)